MLRFGARRRQAGSHVSGRGQTVWTLLRGKARESATFCSVGLAWRRLGRPLVAEKPCRLRRYRLNPESEKAVPR